MQVRTAGSVKRNALFWSDVVWVRARVGFGRLFPSPPPQARAGPRLSGKVSPAGSGGRGKDVCVIRNRAGPFYVSEFEHALTSCSHRLKPSDRVRAPGQPSVANVWKSLWSLVSRAVRGNAEGSYGRPEEGDAETAV